MQESYLKSDNAGRLSEGGLPTWITQDNKKAANSITQSAGICAYFSRADLENNILSASNDPDGVVEVFIVDEDIQDGQTTLNARTLVVNGPGTASMPRLSELPCPPHCGSDYIGM